MWPFNGKNDEKTSNLQSNEAATQADTQPITPSTPDSNLKIQHLIILDASGSMESIKAATISGFNEVVQGVIQGQQQHPEVHNMVSLVIFNSAAIQRTLWIQPASSIHPLNERTYQPNGGTPLYDAIGVSATRLEDEIGNDPDTKVIVNIITDGEENASSHFNVEDIKKLVDRLTEKGWVFTYIGANQDAMYEAGRMNIRNSMQFDAHPEDVKRMFSRERSAKVSFMRRVSERRPVEMDDYYKDVE